MDPITAIIVNLIIGVVLSLASSLISQALGQRDRQQSTGRRGSVHLGGDVPQSFLVGTVGVGGKLEYPGEWGTSGGTPNAYAVDEISLGDLPITGLAGLLVNGERVTVSTGSSSANGYVVPEYNLVGAPKLWWRFRDGTQTTADSYLRDKFGSHSERPWASNMIGRGIPSLTMTALWHGEVWTNFPIYLAEVEGIRLYDVRKDSTRGGDGPQRWAGAVPTPEEQATWSFSDNNMVIAYNIERGIYYNGQHVWGGRKTAAQLPYDVWAPAMDACDTLVNLKEGGSEKAYRAGREIFVNETPADVITELLVGSNARRAETSDGTVYVIVGVPVEADASIADADVLATEPVGTIPSPALDEMINGATATYLEPDMAWEWNEAPPYYRADLEGEDDGRRQVETLKLPTTFSGTQAQRVLKHVVEDARRIRRHVVVLPSVFARYRPLQVFAWTSDRFGYSAKKFLITTRTITPFGTVVFGLQEIDPADGAWDPEEDEQPVSFAPVVISRPAPQPMTGWTAIPATMQDPDGNGWLPSIEVGWAAGLVDVRAVRVVVREAWGGGRHIFDGEYPYDAAELTPSRIINAQFLRARPYDARGIYVPWSGRETEWSEWIGATTPDVSTIPPASIDIGSLVQELRNIVGPIQAMTQEAVAALDERLGALAIVVAGLEEATSERLSGLSARNDEAAAAVARLELAIVGPGGALAQLTEQVTAVYDNLSANGMLQITSEVDELTGTSTIHFNVKATNGEFTSEAALRLGATVGVGGAESFIQGMADRWDFLSTAGEFVGNPFSIQDVDGTPSVVITDLYFGNIYSVAATSGGDPIIQLIGETGDWTILDDA